MPFQANSGFVIGTQLEMFTITVTTGDLTVASQFDVLNKGVATVGEPQMVGVPATLSVRMAFQTGAATAAKLVAAITQADALDSTVTFGTVTVTAYVF